MRVLCSGENSIMNHKLMREFARHMVDAGHVVDITDYNCTCSDSDVHIVVLEELESTVNLEPFDLHVIVSEDAVIDEAVPTLIIKNPDIMLDGMIIYDKAISNRMASV